MASTFAVTRNHLIFGVCLPFAVLLGYLLADVNDPVSKFVIAAAIAVLSFPLLMRWYHPLLIVCWNMPAQATFLPGAPTLWVCMSMIGLFFAVLNRSINPENKFALVPSLTLPILTLAGVVIVTAAMTGGINAMVLGASAKIGGRSYVYLLSAIIGFFALSSRTISPKHAWLFLALFYLPGLTSVFSRLALWIGPSANFITYLFPGELSDPFSQKQGEVIGETRITEMMGASFAVFAWMLARYGIPGVFDLTRPWRLVFFIGGISMGFLGGFRSHLILVMLTFTVLFIVEGAWRTRAMGIVMMIGMLFALLLAGFSDKLPVTVQRSFSFLPIQIDPIIKVQTDSSSQWRLEIWKNVMHEVPMYIFRGKGYVYSADDMYMAQYNMANMGSAGSSQWAETSGDYHNGPLSLLIPFGIWGLLAFMWLIAAGALYLYKNYQRGRLELRTINAFLFAYFTAKAIFFFAIFGAVAFELSVFTGILGLSIALNTTRAVEPDPAGELTVQT